ncbi:MAG: hypothetical protein SPJ60_02105, partial [Sodaliphilus sp.]|nr:hypothetical protein [Sodaliphilus sp.]
IAGCISIDSGNDSYLWYMTSKKHIYRKRAMALSVWAAINHAHQQKRPFGDATDLVSGRRAGCGVDDSSPCFKSDMPQH